MPPHMPPQMPPQIPPHMQQPGINGNAPHAMPPQQGMPPQNDGWGRNVQNANAYPAPASIDGSVGDDRRRSSGAGAPPARGGNKRRRSPSPPGRRGRRGNSPPRVSRHTPPDDFPEGIPWLLSQLASKTVFAAHGPILDWQHLLHLISTTPLPPTQAQQQARGRDRSLSPRRGHQGGSKFSNTCLYDPFLTADSDITISFRFREKSTLRHLEVDVTNSARSRNAPPIPVTIYIIHDEQKSA